MYLKKLRIFYFIWNLYQTLKSNPKIYVAVNFFISGNFCFSFVSTSLEYPKTNEKQALPETKN